VSPVQDVAGQTIEAARRGLAATLQRAAIETPELDARLLLGHVLQLDLTAMIADRARRVTAAEAAELAALTRRRIAGEPVARLLGQQEFWSLTLELSAETLVPRPDTETIVSTALDILRSEGRITAPLRIADLGTGSGAILLALLHELPHAAGIGTDISQDALRTAGRNAARLGLAARASFVASDYAAALTGPFDLIVSNPPYIPSGDIGSLPVEVRAYDPGRALDGGHDGLDAYRAILAQARSRLARHGTLILEIGQHQAPDVAWLAGAAGLVPHGPPRPDLAGIPRVLAYRPGPDKV